MTVKTRLVANIAVVLVLALRGLALVVSTLTAKQAREDGLRYAAALAAAEAREVETDLTRQLATAQHLSRTLAVMAESRQGNRAVAEVTGADAGRDRETAEAVAGITAELSRLVGRFTV